MASQRDIDLAAHTRKPPIHDFLLDSIGTPNVYTGAHLAAVRQALRDRNPDRTEEEFGLLFEALHLDRDFEPDGIYTLTSTRRARVTPSGAAAS